MLDGLKVKDLKVEALKSSNYLDSIHMVKREFWPYVMEHCSFTLLTPLDNLSLYTCDMKMKLTYVKLAHINIDKTYTLYLLGSTIFTQCKYSMA